MVINVGSQNPTKIEAVENLVKGHPLFNGAVVKGVEVNVEEFGHPKSLDETVKGAKRRAKESFKNCRYSFGLESGLLKSKDAKSGYFDSTVCAIYDGQQFHLGISPSYEWPKSVVKLILNGTDGSHAFKQIGLTKHDKIGIAEGAIYILTHGKMSRLQLNELAVMMALIHLENPDHY
jgi:inosine/xanthosine triphosphatase